VHLASHEGFDRPGAVAESIPIGYIEIDDEHLIRVSSTWEAIGQHGIRR
jgi:hypothetical protein